MRKVLLIFIASFNLATFSVAQEYDKIHEASGGFKRVEKDGKTGFLNESDELVIPLMYEAAYDFNQYKVAGIKKDGLIGFIDKNNKFIVEPKFKGIFKINEFEFYRVEIDGKKGLYDFKGQEIVSLIYDDIMVQGNTGFLTVQQNGKQGLIDRKGKLVTSLVYEKIYSPDLGISPCKIDKNTYTFINEKGVQFKETYDDVFSFSADGLARVMKDEKIGYVDLKGKLVVPFSFSNGQDFKDGHAFVIKDDQLGRVDVKGVFEKFGKGMGNPYDSIYIGQKGENLIPATVMKKYAFIDYEGQIVIPPVYDWVDYFNSGIACVGKDGKYGAINQKNEVIIPLKYTFLERYKNEKIIVMNLDKAADIYTTDGELLASCESISTLGKDYKGQYTVIIKGVKKYIDLDGNIYRDKTEDELANEKAAKDRITNWEEAEKKKNKQTISTATPVGTKGSAVALKIKYVKSYEYRKDYINEFSFDNDEIITYGSKYVDQNQKSGWKRSIGKVDYSKLDAFDENNFATGTEGKFIMGVKISANEIISNNGIRLIKYKMNQSGGFDSLISARCEYELVQLQKVDENYVVALGTGKYSKTSLTDIYLYIWDHKNNKTTTLLLAKGSFYNPVQFLKTSTGNLLFAFDTYDADLDDFYETYLEMIDFKETVRTGKITSKWKNQYSLANHYRLTDLIEDKNGDFVGAFQSHPAKLLSTKEEDLNYSIDLGIAKIDKEGKTFKSKVIKSLSPEQWGRSSSSCKLNMRNMDEIKFASTQPPKIVQSPFDDGYIVLCRFAYGIWEYECDGKSFYKGKISYSYSGHTGMYSDQPAFIYIDGQSLDAHSADFIETTGEDMPHSTQNYKRSSTLGQNFQLVDFCYFKSDGKFLLLEKNSNTTYLYTFSLSLYDNWSGGEAESAYDPNAGKTSSSSVSSNTNKNNSTSNGNSSSDTKKDQSETYSGQVYFHFDSNNKSKGERLYIHYGSNAAYKASTTVGSEASIKCEEGKVYYSFTGEKKDMILITELKPSDCKKKFYSKDFVK